MDIESVILTEVRELRATVDQLADDTKQRLAALEAHDHDIYGNGQPGRMKTAESRISALEHWRIYLAGIAAAVSFAIGVAIKLWG